MGMATWVAWRSGLAGGRGAAGPSPHASRSAAANSPQLGKRASGSFAIARLMTPSTAPGRSVRRVLSSGGDSDNFAHTTAIPASRRNGGAPESNSKAAQASAYRSARPSTRPPSTCSGAM